MTKKYDNYFQMITDTILNPTVELCTKERLTDSKNGEEHYTIENAKDDARVIKKDNSEFEILLPGGYSIRHLNDDENGEIIQFFLPGKIVEMARFSNKSTHKESFDMLRRDSGLADIIPISENGISDRDLNGYLNSIQSLDFLKSYNRFKAGLYISRANNGTTLNGEYENPISNNSTDWTEPQKDNSSYEQQKGKKQGIVVGTPRSNKDKAHDLSAMLNGRYREISALQVQLLKNSKRKKSRRLPEDKQ